MKEFDLDSIWKEADAGADQYFQQIAPDLEEKARKQSGSIMERVQRVLLLEIGLSILALGVILLMLPISPFLIGLVVLTAILSLALPVYYYVKFRNLQKDLGLVTILETLETNLLVLNTFIRQLHVFYGIGIPIGFYLGLALPSIINVPESLSPEKLVALGVIALLCIPVLYYLVKITKKKYIYHLYTHKRDELQEIYDKLDSQS